MVKQAFSAEYDVISDVKKLPGLLCSKELESFEKIFNMFNDWQEPILDVGLQFFEDSSDNGELTASNKYEEGGSEKPGIFYQFNCWRDPLPSLDLLKECSSGKEPVVPPG